MAFSQNDALRLAELLAKVNNTGPVDPESTDGKKIFALMEKLNNAYDPNRVSDVNFADLLDKFALKRDLAIARGEILDEEKVANETVQMERKRHMRRLEARIKLLLKDKENNEDELQALKDEYKINADILKVEKNTEQAAAKGDAMADNMMQTLLLR